jgi:hypothetical protein
MMYGDVFFAVIKTRHLDSFIQERVEDLTASSLYKVGAQTIHFFDDFGSMMKGFERSPNKRLIAVETGILMKPNVDLKQLFCATTYPHGAVYRSDGDNTEPDDTPSAYFVSKTNTWYDPSENVLFSVGVAKDMNSLVASIFLRDIKFQYLGGSSFNNYLNMPIYFVNKFKNDGTDVHQNNNLSADQQWFRLIMLADNCSEPFYGNREAAFDGSNPSLLNGDYYALWNSKTYTGPDATWGQHEPVMIRDLLNRDQPGVSTGLPNQGSINSTILQVWLDTNRVYYHNAFHSINNKVDLKLASLSDNDLESSNWAEWLVASDTNHKPGKQTAGNLMSYGFRSSILKNRRQIDIGVFYSTLPIIDTIKLLHYNRTNDGTKVIYLRNNPARENCQQLRTGYDRHHEFVDSLMAQYRIGLDENVRRVLWENTIKEFGGELEFKRALDKYARMEVTVIHSDSELSFTGQTDVYVNFGQLFCEIRTIAIHSQLDRQKKFADLIHRIEKHRGITAEGYNHMGKRYVHRS